MSSVPLASVTMRAAPPRRAVARSFAAAALTYDAHAVLQRRVAARLLSLLPEPAAVQEPQCVLDLGCGTGYCANALQARWPAADLLALDLALPMLQTTRTRVPTARLLCADAQALPLATGSIDLIVSSLAIQWCGDTARLHAELARVLKRGGRVLLSTFGPASLRELRAAWDGLDSHTHVNDFVAAELLLEQARAAGLQATLQRELLVEHVASLQDFSRSLKSLGAHHVNATQAPGLTSPRRFRQAADRFAAAADAQGRIPVSWELYYLTLEHAHEPSSA